MKKDIKIDFWGIGAQKSGTTWLFSNLKKIPEFDLPPVKEFHYFDRNSDYPSPNKLSKTFLRDRIFNFKYLLRAGTAILKKILKRDLKSLKFYLKWYFSNYSDSWYLSLFKNFNKYKGEITPSYSILNAVDVKRMYDLSPNAKLVLMLRNPINRAWSHYRFNTRKTTNYSFEDVSYAEIINFLESDAQELRSNYLRTINNFSKFFPNDQILICFYDAIADNPEKLMKEITNFICGDKKISTSHLKLKNVVHKSIKIECPPAIESYLKDKYYNMIKQLSNEYGGYFNNWLEETYGEKSSNKNDLVLPTINI